MRAAHKVRITLAGLIAVAVVALTGLPSGAQEAEYPGVLNTTLSRTTVQQCGNEGLTATTTGLAIGSTATFTLFSDPVVLGTAVANEVGTAVLTFDLPAGTTLGEHTLRTDGTLPSGAPARTEVKLQVTTCAPGGGGGGGGSGSGSGSSGSGTGGNLARTGTDLSNPLRLAVVLFAVGAALILAARKRQTRTA
jgi:hexosaminidase